MVGRVCGYVLKVRCQVPLFTSGGKAFRLPKGKRDRQIPLPESVRDEIASHLSDYPARSVALPWDTTEGNSVAAALVLTTPSGSALSRTDFNRSVWAPALLKAGVERTRDNGCHALRHF